MITKAYKVYGANGHRQKISFQKSDCWNFSTPDNIRIIQVLNSDITQMSHYSIVIISRNTEEECIREFEGQLSDGIFENARIGKIVELF